MSEIPADILETTNKLVNHYVNPYEPRPDCRPDFRPYLRKLIAEALAAERQRDRWQPIETAPKDGTVIDLWGINHLHYAKAGTRIVNVAWGPVRDWMGHEREDWQHGRGDDFEPTHWMPLPPKPHHFNQEGK